MGTRGLIGIRFNELFICVYNHWDSYPSGLGQKVVDFINYVNKNNKWNLFKNRIREVKLVSLNSKPTKPQKAKYLKYADLSVSEQSLNDWYCLLRKTHFGDWLCEVLKGELKHLVSDVGCFEKSSWCQYAYILNLDNMEIEFYEDIPNLLKSISFYEIPDNWIKEVFGDDQDE